MSPSADHVGLASTGRAPAKSKPSLANRRLIHPESTSSSCCLPRGRLTLGAGHWVRGSVGTLSGLRPPHHHGMVSVKRFVRRANPRSHAKNFQVPRSAIILALEDFGSRQLLETMRGQVIRRKTFAPQPQQDFCLRRFRQTHAAFSMGRISSSTC